MSDIVSDICDAVSTYRMRAIGSGPDFVIIPHTRIDELKDVTERACTFGPRNGGAASFQRLMDDGEVLVMGLPVFRGARMGAGCYRR